MIVLAAIRIGLAERRSDLIGHAAQRILAVQFLWLSERRSDQGCGHASDDFIEFGIDGCEREGHLRFAGAAY